MTGQTTIITVCYNSSAVVAGMLDSVPHGVPVVLVDNASDDLDALQKLATARDAKVIANATNKGFGVGNNQGVAQAKTPFVLLLNPDATLDPDCLAALEQGAAAHPRASAFNPRLLDRKGAEIFRRKTRLDPSFQLTGPPPEQDSEIPTMLGAAIFLRRDLYEEIGGFDENIFLYHEDDDLSLRLRQHGPLMRLPRAIVTHQEGRGSARTPQVAAFKAYHMARSKVYAYAKHGRRWPWMRTMGEAAGALISPLMFNARKRAKAVGFFKGALSARKDGGRGFG